MNTEPKKRLEAIMKRNGLFENLNSENISDAVALMRGKIKTYKKGEFLHSAGEKFDSFGMVIRGKINVCIDDINGNRMIMANVIPGVSFGESLAYLEEASSPVYIYATEDSEILFLSAKALFMSESPFGRELQRRFISVLARRTLAMNNRIQILSKLSLREKIIAYFSSLKKTSREFAVPLDREDMAAFLGTNRSALSRELSKMKKEGIIDYRKNIFEFR